MTIVNDATINKDEDMSMRRQFVGQSTQSGFQHVKCKMHEIHMDSGSVRQ